MKGSIRWSVKRKEGEEGGGKEGREDMMEKLTASLTETNVSMEKNCVYLI